MSDRGTMKIVGRGPEILAEATLSRDKKFWICDYCKRKSPVSSSSDMKSMLGKHDPGCKAVSRINRAIEIVDNARKS